MKKKKKTPKGPGHLKKPVLQPIVVKIVGISCFQISLGLANSQGSRGATLRQGDYGKTPLIGLRLRFSCPSVPQRNVFVSLFLSLSFTPPPHHMTFQPRPGEGQQTQSLQCVGWYVTPNPSTQRTQCHFCSLHSAPLPTTSQLHMPGCNWLLAQDSPLTLGSRGILSGFQEPPLSSLSPTLPTAQALWALALPQRWLLGLPRPAPVLSWLRYSSPPWVS